MVLVEQRGAVPAGHLEQQRDAARVEAKIGGQVVHLRDGASVRQRGVSWQALDCADDGLREAGQAGRAGQRCLLQADRRRTCYARRKRQERAHKACEEGASASRMRVREARCCNARRCLHAQNAFTCIHWLLLQRPPFPAARSSSLPECCAAPPLPW